MTKYSKNWNKEEQRAYMREYGRINANKLNEQRKLRIINNPAYANSIKLSRAKWVLKNKGYFNIYNKKRKTVDPAFKLRMYLRSRVNKAIRGIVKQGSAVNDLGCSIQEFKKYIERQFTGWMCWATYGEWELDHIIALSKFDLTNKEQFAKACHYTNYQPLWKSDNRAKRNQ